VTVTVVHIAGGSGPQCPLAAPVPSLNAQLRALGGFDQPYDAADTAVLERLAQQAAAASAPSLIGATPAAPVRMTSLSASRPDAMVVPLRSAGGEDRAPQIAGLAAFLLDCSGRAYYSAVEALPTRESIHGSFPAVTADAAGRRLGTDSPQLCYATTPFQPVWRNPASGATTPAE